MAKSKTILKREHGKTRRDKARGKTGHNPTQDPDTSKDSETLDNVLADLDYEHIALGFDDSEQQESANRSVSSERPTINEGSVEQEQESQQNLEGIEYLVAFGELFDHLYPRNLHDKLQNLADGMAGTSFNTAARNSPLVKKFNQVVNGAGFQLIYPETGEKVRLRFIDPPRAKAGYFQLRTANSEQRGVYTGAGFPTLQITSSDNV